MQGPIIFRNIPGETSNYKEASGWSGVEWNGVRRQEHSDGDIVIMGLGGGAMWQAHCKDFR